VIKFTSLLDALHAGYHVIGPTHSGYVVRLVQADGSESWGLVVFAQDP
jgi:hypothetical protein